MRQRLLPRDRENKICVFLPIPADEVLTKCNSFAAQWSPRRKSREAQAPGAPHAGSSRNPQHSQRLDIERLHNSVFSISFGNYGLNKTAENSREKAIKKSDERTPPGIFCVH